MSSLQLKVVSDPQQLAPYLPFWQAHAATPLQGPEWLMAWWTAFENHNALLNILIVQTAQGQIIGLAPLYVRNHWTDGKTLRFLGSGRACTDFQTLLSAPGREEEVGAFIGHWLVASQSELNWGMLELEGIRSNDAAVVALVEALQHTHCRAYPTQLESTWRLDLSGGWQGYLDGLSRTQRSQTRNLVNRFDKNADWSLRIVDTQNELGDALQHCMDLHQKRWTAVGEPGCFADPRFTNFVQHACQQLVQSQRVRLALIEDQGVPIACHIYLLDAAGNRYMYQSARDPARSAERVGQILNALEVRLATAEGVEFIDYLRGDETYKRRLGAAPADCLRIRVVAPRLVPRVRHGLRVLGRSVKQQVSALRDQWSKAPRDNEHEHKSTAAACAVSSGDAAQAYK